METFESPSQPDPARNVAAQTPKRAPDDAAIVSTPLNPEWAFETFAGHVYDRGADDGSGGVDFSDSAVVRARLRTLTSQQTELTSPGARHAQRHARFESPLEKYNRLHSEVTQFGTDLRALAQQLQQRGGGDSSDDTKSKLGDVDAAMLSIAQHIAVDLQSIQSDLGALMADSDTAALLASDDENATAGNGRLSSDALLRSLKDATSASSSASAAESASHGTCTSATTYELYASAASSSGGGGGGVAVSGPALTALEQRLATLESTVGVRGDGSSDNGGDDAATTSADNYPDVRTGIAALTDRLDLLDAGTLDVAFRRVRTLAAEFDELERTRAKTEAAAPTTTDATTAQLHAMYDMMTRWDAACLDLPLVIARLKALRAMHEQSALVVQRVARLEQTDAQLTEMLTTDRALLQRVHDGLAENATVMTANVAAIQSRMDSITAKLAALDSL